MRPSGMVRQHSDMVHACRVGTTTSIMCSYCTAKLMTATSMCMRRATTVGKMWMLISDLMLLAVKGLDQMAH